MTLPDSSAPDILRIGRLRTDDAAGFARIRMGLPMHPRMTLPDFAEYGQELRK